MTSAETPIPVILVEDDDELREGVVEYLNLTGFQVVAVANGAAYRQQLDTRPFAVAVIDLGLPDEDGTRLVAYTRQRTEASVIVLTARNTSTSRIGVYEHGADLFLAKPVEGSELAAAIHSLSRRFQQRQGLQADKAGPAGWQFDQVRRKLVTPAGQVLPVTTKEAALLQLLVQGQGRPVPRADILMALYGRDDESSLAALNTLVGRLRQKITAIWEGDSPVVTEHGVGYRVVLS